MHLYTSYGPNPAVVNAFLLQKGATLETTMLDITQAQSRSEPYISWNPSGAMPLLKLDDGSFLAESTVICEYLDGMLAGASLIGDTPERRAHARMWVRRVDLNFVQPSSLGWRYAEGLSFCRRFMHVIPHAADDLKVLARQGLAWIDRHATGDFLAGDGPTLADILLYVFVQVGDAQGQPVDPALAWVRAWRRRMGGEPLAAALAA